MAKDRNKEVARAELSRLGFLVEDIPERPDLKRADFTMRFDDEVYIVEVKTRTIRDDYLAQLRRGGIAVNENILGRVNTVVGRVREARQQLIATPAPMHAYRIIVLVAAGWDAGDQVTQFEYTLYGIKDVLPDLDAPIFLRCYYGTYSEFCSFQDIDATLIVGPRGTKVCPNYQSQRLSHFRTTRLYSDHAMEGAITDPEGEEASKTAYISDILPADDRMLESHLRGKYGLRRPLVLNFKSDSAEAFVPDRTP